MSKKEEKMENVTTLDEARIKRLATRGHYNSLLEEFEKLRLKFFYEKTMSKEEAIKLITLAKYFMQNAPSEAFRMSCKYFYEKYAGKFGL